MKRNLILLASCVALTGCAHFSTKQTDTSYDKDAKKPSREIVTRASSWTFFSAKSDLAKFKALQTDKSQSASVGTLGQSTDAATNVVSIIEAVVGAAVKAAASAK